jgi:hypothetical protein
MNEWIMDGVVPAEIVAHQIENDKEASEMANLLVWSKLVLFEKGTPGKQPCASQ